MLKQRKVSFVNWLEDLDVEQTEVFYWSNDTWGEETGEIELTSEEEQKLIFILSKLTEDNITWNKHLAGITPE